MDVTLSGAKGLILQPEILRSAQHDSLGETMTNARFVMLNAVKHLDGVPRFFAGAQNDDIMAFFRSN